MMNSGWSTIQSITIRRTICSHFKSLVTENTTPYDDRNVGYDLG